MKINFPRIVREFSLSEYVPELDISISVWVNPPRAFRAKLAESHQAYIDAPDDVHFDAFLSGLSELLSQGRDDTRWSVADLRELIDQTVEIEPAFWHYFQNRILQTISAYMDERKKVLAPPAPS